MAFITPGTVVAGDVLTAARYNQDVVANGTELAPFFAAWTTWTPAIVQSGARTVTVTHARYLEIGKMVIAKANLTITQTGSAGNAISCSLPLQHAATGDIALGSFFYIRTGVTRYVGTCLANNNFTSPGIIFHQTGPNVLGVDPNFATANDDRLTFTVTYEAA
jgi:hypothetical protein